MFEDGIVNDTLAEWIIFWACSGTIWAWYGELGYYNSPYPARTVFLEVLSILINVILYPVSIWFGVFVFVSSTERDENGVLMKDYNLIINLMNRNRKESTGHSEEK